MPFDSLSGKKITEELREKLLLTKIHKIYQPIKDEVVLYFSDRDKSRLLISANPSFARMHLVEETFENPVTPPSFCMLMRKYILGAIVKDIAQVGFDRVFYIDMENLDEGGSLLRLRLYVEIMGRHSNIILVNCRDNRILDSIVHVNYMKSSVREVLPGKEYVLPVQERLNPLCYDEGTAESLLSLHKGKAVANALQNVFCGLSNQLAKSLSMVIAPNAKSMTDIVSIDDALKKFNMEMQCLDSCPKAYLYLDETGKTIDFTCGRYAMYEGIRVKEYDSANQACYQYYLQKGRTEHIVKRYEHVFKKLNVLLSKEENKLKIREKEYINAEDGEKYNEMGNLLLSNLHILKKGMDSVTVDDYYVNPPVRRQIPLKPQYTPSQNAQWYFKKYTKAKNAVQYLDALIRENKEDIYYIESQFIYLRNAQNAQEADEILDELYKKGILKRRKKGFANRKIRESGPYHYETEDGFEIFVGKNDRMNDRLTLKSSYKDDLWLHTKDIPGSHVILKTNHGKYSEDALRVAAALAAYYSKGVDSENVPVDYAYVKYVKKPSGAPLGRVIYTNNRTVYVTPRKNIFDSLKKYE